MGGLLIVLILLNKFALLCGGFVACLGWGFKKRAAQDDDALDIHVVDVNAPRPAFENTFSEVTMHRGSVADKVGSFPSPCAYVGSTTCSLLCACVLQDVSASAV